MSFENSRPKSKTPKYIRDYMRKYRKRKGKFERKQQEREKFQKIVDSGEHKEEFASSKEFDVENLEWRQTIEANRSKISKYAYDYLCEERQKRMQSDVSEIAPFTYIINAVDDELFGHPDQKLFYDYKNNPIVPTRRFINLPNKYKNAPLFWLRELVLDTLIVIHKEDSVNTPFWRAKRDDNFDSLIFELKEMTQQNLDVLEGKEP